MKVYRRIKLWILMVFLLGTGILSGCSDRPEDAAAAAAKPGNEIEAASESLTNTGNAATNAMNEGASIVSETTNTAVDVGADSISTPKIKDLAEDYKVAIAMKANLTTTGPPAVLRVWIGNIKLTPRFSNGLSTAEKEVTAIGVVAAKIKPVAPGFEGPKKAECRLIDSTYGSEFPFELKPKEAGEFEVGALVDLFHSLDCTGTPIPKTTTFLIIKVTVDWYKIIQERMIEVWNKFWHELLDFWGASLALVFGSILFLMKSTLKKLFGCKN